MAATTSNPKGMMWAGWILGLVPAGMLTMSAVMKFMQPKEVVEGFTKLGWPLKLAVPLGIVELACVVVYMFPPTCVLGAILITGYLGGATATHVRLEEAFYTPVGLGVLAWLGVFLRDPRVRQLIPLRR